MLVDEPIVNPLPEIDVENVWVDAVNPFNPSRAVVKPRAAETLVYST